MPATPTRRRGRGCVRSRVEIGVPDLGEVGDIMSLVGDQGAQVYQTLFSRAQSMRVALRTKEQQRAATATTLLYVPTTMLLLVFLVLIGYPALSASADDPRPMTTDRHIAAAHPMEEP